MAKKLNFEDLNDVSGGACGGTKCAICGCKLSSDYWEADYRDLKKDMIKHVAVCNAHYASHQKNPNFSNWKKV